MGGTTAQVVDALRDWLHDRAEPEPVVVETSGSTGTPKRVVLSRRALVASATATAVRLGETGPWLLALPATYVAGVQVIVRSLLAGHEPVLVDALPEAVARAGAPAFLSLVPTQLRRHLAVPSDVEALRSLHTVLLGGGPIDSALRRTAEDAGIHVVATYGSSETGGGCVYDGYPLDGVSLDVTDGRIRIAGPMLFDGYLDDPALTRETLVDGWFVTSDLGRLHDDGRLEVLGRVDDVVISGGVNVPTPAVARRLAEHPSVAQVEVIGVPDPEWGQRVVAVVVPSPGAVGPSRDEARDWVAAAHPRAWAPYEIFVTGELPLLANGKVDRVRLQGLFA